MPQAKCFYESMFFRPHGSRSTRSSARRGARWRSARRARSGCNCPGTRRSRMERSMWDRWSSSLFRNTGRSRSRLPGDETGPSREKAPAMRQTQARSRGCRPIIVVLGGPVRW